ncbi:hypothetical protein D3C76_1182430 [compost metagenome]
MLFVLVYLMYDFHRPQAIHKSYISTIYSYESQFEQQTVVSIEGKLYKNLFGKDIFLGEMIADEDMKYELKLKEEGNYYSQTLTVQGKDRVHSTMGSIRISLQFDKLWIQLNDINEKYSITEGYISGPARNMEEAKDIARRLAE